MTLPGKQGIFWNLTHILIRYSLFLQRFRTSLFVVISLYLVPFFYSFACKKLLKITVTASVLTYYFLYNLDQDLLVIRLHFLELGPLQLLMGLICSRASTTTLKTETKLNRFNTFQMKSAYYCASQLLYDLGEVPNILHQVKIIVTFILSVFPAISALLRLIVI